MFFDQAERFGERPFLWRKRDGSYRPISWRETAARVCAFARGLTALGLARGDRVVVVAENRPAWLIADLAIMAAGGITVPAYTTNTEADHRYILENSGACGIVTSAARYAEPLLRAADGVAATRFLIGIEPVVPDRRYDVELFTWQDVIARGSADHTNLVAAAETPAPEDAACIIYTSGTGGTPKGVVLPHRAILHNVTAGAEILAALGDDHVFLSFLPLSHAYEHTAGQFLSIGLGAEIFYAEGIERVAANLREARPTLLTAVPRFYELLHLRITSEVRRTGGWRERLFLEALRIGGKRHRDPRRLSLPERLIDPVLDRLVRRRLKERFGGRLRAMISGGAPLNPEIGLFFTALGLPVYNGYGQTEAAPLISVNRPGNAKPNTVGPPLPGVEVRIADDGEILVRGPMVMLGYWRNEEATRDALRDGWLHTGDIGEIDDDGHLRIVDRKKDIIVNSGGDNVSPARVEALLTMRPEIAQAAVFGDGRPHLVALLVPREEWLRNWARTVDAEPDPAALADDPRLVKALRQAVEEVNRDLSVIETIRRFAVVAEPFGIDNGQLTPTLKIRRHAVLAAHRATIERLYD
jgi:long-chain acyl-CoA synthetase